MEEDEDEDPEFSKTVEAAMTQHGRLDRRSYSQTGTISRGGTRETVGWFVMANRYELVNERVCSKAERLNLAGRNRR